MVDALQAHQDARRMGAMDKGKNARNMAAVQQVQTAPMGTAGERRTMQRGQGHNARDGAQGIRMDAHEGARRHTAIQHGVM